MVNDLENIKSQPQEEEIIKRALKEDEISFKCPNCNIKINEALFGKDGQNFRLLIDKCIKIAKGRWLEEIEQSKKYEEFAGFTNLQRKLKEKEEIIESITRDFQEKEKGYIKNIAEKSSSKVEELSKQIGEKNEEIQKLKSQEQKIIGEYKEKLTAKELEYTRELLAKEKELEKVKSDAKSADVIMNSELYKKIEKERNEYKKVNEELNHPNYIENSKRVKDLEAEKKQLNIQIQSLKDQGRMSKKKGEDLEKFVIEQLQTTYNGTDTITKITHIGEKADISQTIHYNQLLVGKVIYEIKNVDKWENKWLDKLEKDMVSEKADYGIIIATCRAGNPLWKPFPQKNILVSDDDNFIFASQMARLLILNRQRFQESEEPEERIKKFEGWMREKLPNYLLRLEKKFTEWEVDITRINNSVKSIGKVREEIRNIIVSEIELELRGI